MSENKEEDKYFKQRELERREAARRERELAALRQTEREGIAEVLNTTEEIAEEALELGFSQETARVLPLIPLIHRPFSSWAGYSLPAGNSNKRSQPTKIF